MTAPDPDAPVDPLVCINARMVGRPSKCGFPENDHCEGCQSCPGLGNCACPPPSPWKKGDRVRITFDAVYYAEPSIKPDVYALVVLPGTSLDGNPLILDRFRVPLTAITALDGDPAPLDEAMLTLALDAYAKHAGAPDWKTFVDRVPQHVADNAYECTLAAVTPLLSEIQRLTNERAGLAVDIDTEIENAPAMCFTQDDYAAGFIAGLARALQLVRGQDQTAEAENLKHSKETS